MRLPHVPHAIVSAAFALDRPASARGWVGRSEGASSLDDERIEATRCEGLGSAGARGAAGVPAMEEARLSWAQVLHMANGLARAAVHRLRLGEPEAAADIAAESLLIIVEKSLRVRPMTLVAVVTRTARRHAAAFAARREILGGYLPDIGVGGGWLLDEVSEEASMPPVRQFCDGSQVALPDRCWCEANLEWLVLESSDGSRLRGRTALSVAQALLLAERPAAASRLQQSGNTRRCVAALQRDALLLQVAALPWQEALAWLAQRGVFLSRAALRSSLRAARRRCEGKSAHEPS